MVVEKKSNNLMREEINYLIFILLNNILEDCRYRENTILRFFFFFIKIFFFILFVFHN